MRKPIFFQNIQNGRLDLGGNNLGFYSSWKDFFKFANEFEEVEEEHLKRKRVSTEMNAFSTMKLSRRSQFLDREEEKEENAIRGTQIVKIEIMDSGIGISKEGISKLFQPFRQAEASISGNFGGTGLGLWISKSIIQLMQGDIRIYSKPNRGTNVVVAFPADPAYEQAFLLSEELPSDCPADLLEHQHCIIIEDIEENLVVLQKYLEKFGMIVHAFKKGKNAVDYYCSHNRVKLVITDLRLPDISGQSVILKIRKNERKLQRIPVPIIVLTAESSAQEKSLCLGTYGANDYLVKPIRMVDLVKSIKNSLLIQVKTQSKRILIIDDDILSSKVMTILLTKMGHIVKCCSSVGSATEEFAAHSLSHNIILLDNQLPDGTGLNFLQFYEKFFSEHSLDPIPIISLSGHSISIQEELYKNYPVTIFLEKPLSKSLLSSTIKAIKQRTNVLLTDYF